MSGISLDRITGADVMAAIVTTCNQARFGLAAFFGKAGVSKSDKQLAVQALARYAVETAPKNVHKAAGGSLGRCMLVLSQFAFAEYSRSAANTATCLSCYGIGFTERWEDVVKHPGIFNEKGEEVWPPNIKHENVKRLCISCNGKGVLAARCRCGGRGEVLDRKAREERGAPVFKTCERCSGQGYSSLSSATVHRAILKLLPDLHQSSWSRNWKLFYERLVDKCHQEESKAESAFRFATRSEI